MPPPQPGIPPPEQALQGVLIALGMLNDGILAKLPIARETCLVRHADKASLDVLDTVFEDICMELARCLYPVDYQGYGGRVRDMLTLGKLQEPARELLNRAPGGEMESRLVRGMICEGLGREDAEKVLGPMSYDDGMRSWEYFKAQSAPPPPQQQAASIAASVAAPPPTPADAIMDYDTDIRRMMTAAKKAKNKMANASVMLKVLQKAYPFRDDIPSEADIERIMSNCTQNFVDVNETLDSFPRLADEGGDLRRNSISVRYQRDIEAIGELGSWLTKPRDVLLQLKAKYDTGSGLPEDWPTDQQVKNRYNSQKTKRTASKDARSFVRPEVETSGTMPMPSVVDAPTSSKDFAIGDPALPNLPNLSPVNPLPEITDLPEVPPIPSGPAVSAAPSISQTAPDADSDSQPRAPRMDHGHLRKNSIMPMYQRDILDIAEQNNWQYKAREVVSILKRKYETPQGFPPDFPSDDQVKNRYNSQKTKRPKI